MAGFKNATKAYLAGMQVQSEDIGANVVVAADIATNGVGNAELSAGCVAAGEIQSNAVIGAKISAGTITAAKLSAGTLTATQLATNAVTAAKISAGTITNAKLSSPESYFSLRTRLAKRACNQAAASVAFLGTLPAAAVLVSAYAAASVINNVALTTPPLCVWVNNGTNRLLTGSGIVVPSTAFRAVSGVVQSTAQSAGAKIYAAAKTSTTTSGLGVDIVTTWKINHTT